MRKHKSHELYKFKKVFLALCNASKIINERKKFEKQNIFEFEKRKKEQDELRRREKELKEKVMQEKLRQEKIKQLKEVEKKKMVLLLQQQLKILEGNYNKIKKSGKYKKQDLDKIESKIKSIKQKLKGL